ncbi:hypothetical protein AVEN_238912-1 [Araneus ventricosus]|uniref:Uncharacterized protein n=1 Tax=Araneus ventricosus TaxID=182803 RepID=A0A4Y2PYU7_ARAVE|nr:hypothetical protein AVEN_238912-1 [Araneus ventricosus]
MFFINSLQIPIVDDEIKKASGESKEENDGDSAMTAPVQKLVTADGTYATQSAFSAAPTSVKKQYQSDKPLLPFFASEVLKLVNDCIQHFKILKPENERIEKPETLFKFNFSDPNLYNDKS